MSEEDGAGDDKILTLKGNVVADKRRRLIASLEEQEAGADGGSEPA